MIEPIEDRAYLFGGGSILSCQDPIYWRSRYVRSGEQRLMLALLMDAIRIFVDGRADKRLWYQAREWIVTARPVPGRVSFPDACDALGLNADLLRRRLLDRKVNVGLGGVTWRSSSVRANSGEPGDEAVPSGPGRSRRCACAPLPSAPQVRRRSSAMWAE